MNMLHKTSKIAMNLTSKSLILSALTASLGAISTVPASAQAVNSINLAGKSSVTFVASNLSNTSGLGVHFSTSPNEDGWAGSNAECHFASGSVNMTLLCYDGYQDPQNHTNEFRLELGPKKQYNQDVLSDVTLTVTPQGVDVKAVRIGTNSYTNERKPYTISSSFPLRQSTGFFKTGTLYYKVNGVLNGRSDRPGSGYVLATPTVQ